MLGTLLRCLRAVPAPGAAESELAAELAACLCAELAAMAALGAPLELATLPPRVHCPTAGVVFDVPEGTRRLVFDDGRLSLELPGSARSLVLEPGRAQGDAQEVVRLRPAFAEIEGATRLALSDNNPLASLEAHPDKQGSALDLGGVAPARWVAALTEALGLVAQALPVMRREFDTFVELVVPVGSYDDRHLSASYREALGVVYLSLHPSPMTLAEALVHELQHNKLNALFEHDPVLVDDDEPRHPSARRPDLRPLRGVLLALHAFVPVAAMYERLAAAGHPVAADPGFARRLDSIRASNRADADVVRRCMRPTRVGSGLRDELERLCPTPEPDTGAA